MSGIRVQRTLGAIWLLVVVFAAALAEAARASPANPAPAVGFVYAIYYLQPPDKDPVAGVRAALARQAGGPKLTDAYPKNPPQVPLVKATWLKDARQKYPAPELGALQYFGRGLTAEQSRRLQSAEHALVLEFFHPAGEQAARRVWAADDLALAVARDSDALLWDEETREVFTAAAWAERRHTTWDRSVPNIWRHIVIHAYKQEKKEFVRAVTLGMAKFGLPDLVIQDFSWSVNQPMGHLINAVAQALVEGTPVSADGKLNLDIRSIKHSEVAREFVTSLKPGASGQGTVYLAKSELQPGDAQNRLLEINFPRVAGLDSHATYTRFLSRMFGVEESVYAVRHNAELLELSRQARLRLPAMKAAFDKGLKPGEFIQVKVPFRTSDGSNEYMWVEVSGWRNGRISGMLKNQPRNVPHLQGGQMVEVNESDVFDYVRIGPAGPVEGDETSKLLQKIQGR